jgi:hypothetical protein
MDALDHEHAVLVLDLTSRLADEPAVSCGDLTRLQRASERAGQSPGSRGDDVVERRRSLGLAARLDPVMIRDLVVKAEPDRLCAARYGRAPERAG